MLKLDEDWKSILKYAWSTRLIALAGFLSAVEFIIPFFYDKPPISRGVFAAISFVISIAAFTARFVAQDKVKS